MNHLWTPDLYLVATLTAAASPRPCLTSMASTAGVLRCAVCRVDHDSKPEDIKPLYGIRDCFRSSSGVQTLKGPHFPCKLHSENEYTMFCSRCLVLICDSCIDEEHDGHPMRKLKKYLIEIIESHLGKPFMEGIVECREKLATSIRLKRSKLENLTSETTSVKSEIASMLQFQELIDQYDVVVRSEVRDKIAHKNFLLMELSRNDYLILIMKNSELLSDNRSVSVGTQTKIPKTCVATEAKSTVVSALIQTDDSFLQGKSAETTRMIPKVSSDISIRTNTGQHTATTSRPTPSEQFVNFSLPLWAQSPGPTVILQQQAQNTAVVETAAGLPLNSPLWSRHSGGNAADGQVQPVFQIFTDALQHPSHEISVYNQPPILGTPITPNLSPAPTHIPHAAAFTSPPVEWRHENSTAEPQSYLSGGAATAQFIPAFSNNFPSVDNRNTGPISTPETTVNNEDIKSVTRTFYQLCATQPHINEYSATTIAPAAGNLDPKFSTQTNETPRVISDLNSLTVLTQLDGKRIDGQTMSTNSIDVNCNVNRMSQNYEQNCSQKSPSSSSQSWGNVAIRQKLASKNENVFDSSAGLVGTEPRYQRNEAPLVSTHEYECVNFGVGLENVSWESNTSAAFTQVKNTLRDSTVRQRNNVPPGDGDGANLGAPNDNPEKRRKPYQYHQQNNNHPYQQQQKNHDDYVSESNSINNMAGRTNYRQGGVVSNENQVHATSGYFPQQHQNTRFPGGNLYRPQSGGGSSGGGYRNNPYSSRTIRNPDANVHYQEGSVKQTGVNNDRDKAIIDKLVEKHNINPRSFNCNPAEAKFFVIKSYSEDDIHHSFKHSVWCSTETGNKKLDTAFKSLNGKGPVYLFFSENASGHFCGLAEMKTALDYSTQAGLQQDKWKGRFDVKWILIKDVPNATFRHIIISSNEGKPVTQSRDSQEVPYEQGKEMLKLMFNHDSKTSMLDSFSEYENRRNFRPKSLYNNSKSNNKKLKSLALQLPKQPKCQLPLKRNHH